MNSKPVSEWSRREVGQLVVACGEAGVPCHDSGITRKRWMGMGQSALLRNSLNTTSRCPEKNSCGLQKGVDTEERKRRERGRTAWVSEWLHFFPSTKSWLMLYIPAQRTYFLCFGGGLSCGLQVKSKAFVQSLFGKGQPPVWIQIHI